MFILVYPTGRKVWRLRYRFGGREKKACFGTYPAVSIAAARRLRDDACSLLNEGYDPSETYQYHKNKELKEKRSVRDRINAQKSMRSIIIHKTKYVLNEACKIKRDAAVTDIVKFIDEYWKDYAEF